MALHVLSAGVWFDRDTPDNRKCIESETSDRIRLCGPEGRYQAGPVPASDDLIVIRRKCWTLQGSEVVIDS